LGCPCQKEETYFACSWRKSDGTSGKEEEERGFVSFCHWNDPGTFRKPKKANSTFRKVREQ
jgi:hypothetical protein